MGVHHIYRNSGEFLITVTSPDVYTSRLLSYQQAIAWESRIENTKKWAARN